MKFQSMIRTQLAIAGLGAALLFAGASRAQEIVNTSFPDGPNVGPFTEPVPAEQAVNADSNRMPALPGSEAVQAMAAIAPAQESVAAQEPTTDWLVGILLAGIAAIALYALAVAKRVTREVRTRRESLPF